MSHPIERLEQALRIWEDLCFLGAVSHRASAWSGSSPRHVFEGPVKHAWEFRSSLLRSREQAFDKARFMGPATLAQELLGSLWFLPSLLSAWTSESRRVFHMSAELELLLNATSLSRVQWEDIPWPFDSFAVTLERPIVDSNGDLYDCVLVGILDEGRPARGIRLMLISSDLGRRRPIDAFQRKDIEKALQKKDRSKFVRVWNVARETLSCISASCVALSAEMLAGLPPSASVDEIFRAFDASHDTRLLARDARVTTAHYDSALRLTIALCVYLALLPSDSRHRTAWSPPPRTSKVDPRSIVHGSEICTVSSEHTLSPEERRSLGDGPIRSHAELCAHWRRGHLRYRPRQRDKPGSVKDVWVRPCRVRQDRLQPGSVEGGCRSLVR